MGKECLLGHAVIVSSSDWSRCGPSAIRRAGSPRWRALERRSCGRGADGTGEAVLADVRRAELEPHRRCERMELRADERRRGQRRALVTHPQVMDTGGIERDTFTALPQPPPSDDRISQCSELRGCSSRAPCCSRRRRCSPGRSGLRCRPSWLRRTGRRVVAAARVVAADAVPQTPRAVCLLHDSVRAVDRATNAVTVGGSSAGLPCLTTDARPAAVFGGSFERRRRVAARADVVPARSARHRMDPHARAH